MTSRFSLAASCAAAATVCAPAGAASLSTLYAFPNPAPAPYSPQAGLIKIGGYFFGTTYWGGTANRGTVFKTDIATGHTTTLATFSGADGANPNAAVIYSNGQLYGTTSQGGAFGRGIIFVYNLKTGAKAALHSFSGPDGAYPEAALLDLGGTLYGTASAGGTASSGTIFKLNLSTGAETTLYDFQGGADGATPLAGLVKLGAYLYGTTAYGAYDGTLYRVDPNTGAETVLEGFGGIINGGAPQAPLIVDGQTLYGTTTGGQNAGNVFSYVPATGTYTQLYAFEQGQGDGNYPFAALTASGGYLYGTTENGGTAGLGTVFKVNETSGAETVLASFTATAGGNPLAPLTLVNGALYGTTSSAGFYNAGPYNGLPASLPGTIYKIDPASGAMATLASFPGLNPVLSNTAPMLDLNGLLAGVTAQGGPSGHSAVFTVDAATGQEAILADLGAADLTSAGLAQISPTLYGTTSTGGASGDGTIYSVDQSTGATATLHAFDETDGARPSAPLLALSGALYGTTLVGGAQGGGTVFKIAPRTGKLTTLYNFGLGNDGGEPNAGLLSVGGQLYGTATYGGTGAGFGGVIFVVNPKTGAETVLHDFGGAGGGGNQDGAYPSAALVHSGDTLYGTTPYGGINLDQCAGLGCGVAFSLSTATGAETLLHVFTGGADGSLPDASLVLAEGLLYGTASGGGVYGYGTIFTIDPATGTLTTIYNFTGGNDGATPRAALTENAGTLYGATSFGGAGNAGTVFSLQP